MVSGKFNYYLRITLVLATVFFFISCAPIDPEEGASGEPLVGMDFSPGVPVFDIVPNESTARFLIDEILRGEEKQVVGETSQVSGQISVDFANPAVAAVSPIQVDARTLLTDNGFRNRAVQNRILLTGIYPFVSFTPTSISGLPDSLTIGEAVDFQIEGDLIITTLSKPVVFEVTAVPVSLERIEGSAKATINRADFSLTIPPATGVAAVGEEVVLQIDFVAQAAE